MSPIPCLREKVTDQFSLLSLIIASDSGVPGLLATFAGAAGPRPASGEGKLELTEASCSRANMAEGIPEGFRPGAPWKGCRGRRESVEPWHSRTYRSMTVRSCSRTLQCRSRGSGGGLFQQLVNQRLIGLPLLGCHLPEGGQQPWREPDGDQLLRHPALRPTAPTCSPNLVVRHFRDVREINVPVQYMFSVL